MACGPLYVLIDLAYKISSFQILATTTKKIRMGNTAVPFFCEVEMHSKYVGLLSMIFFHNLSLAGRVTTLCRNFLYNLG